MSRSEKGHLPPELQLKIARDLTTLTDWVHLEQACLDKGCPTWSVGVEALLGEWLRVQPLATLLIQGKDLPDRELQFIRDHIQGAASK
jgi:hypothetical protein